MEQLFSKENPEDFNDSIDFFELFNVVLQGKWLIIFITSFFSITGVIYSLLLPNIYESETVLVPVNPARGLSGALRSYSSLAGLTGLSIPAAGSENNSVKALEKLSSLSFFKNNVLENIFLPDLMAVKSWDSKTKLIIYDESQYDSKSENWIREYSYPNTQIPSAQESFKVLKKII